MNLIDQLKRDEGRVLHVYRDSRGILTAGYGHNCEAHNEGLKEGEEISQEQAELWLLNDSASSSRHVDGNLPWASGLDGARHGVLVNMCFNMGIDGLLKFSNTLAAVESGDYIAASRLMLQSLWATQVGARAHRLSKQMETGIWQ